VRQNRRLDLFPLLLPLPPRWLATVNLPADPAEDKLMTVDRT
jgi:hypothetical protein